MALLYWTLFHLARLFNVKNWWESPQSFHYRDVIIGAIASPITSLTIVYSDADQRKHQSPASLAFVRGIHPPGTGEFPAQMASNAENVSIWWRHHASVLLGWTFPRYAANTRNLCYLELSSWWRHQMETFSASLAICVRAIHRSPVNSLHKGQWRGALMFSLICVWKNDWVNNRGAGDLRRYRAHYDVTVMYKNRMCFSVPQHFNYASMRTSVICCETLDWGII